MPKASKTPAFIFMLLWIVFFASQYCHAESLVVGLEKEIGYDSYRQMIREQRVASLTPEKNRSLRDLFTKLVNHAKRHYELHYTLTVVEDKEVNAFSLPGGYIFVNTGLLDFIDSDGELAGVLAHEIGHVECKHGINALTRALGFTLLYQLLTCKSRDQRQADALGAIAIGLVQKGYSRNAEYQADRYAVSLMTRVGYSKNDMIAFFHKLQCVYGNENGFFLTRLLSTHPPTKERVERIERM